MNIPNVGQAMALGDLYNARTGQCTYISVLSDNFPDSLIESRDEHSVNTFFICEESYKEKFKAFEIDGSLKLDILASTINLNTQGKFLKAEKQSSKSVKISMSYVVQTKLDSLNIRSDNVREFIDTGALSDNEATHVVTGFQWGANMTCSLEHSLEEGETKQEVEGSLVSACNTLMFGAGIGVGPATTDERSCNTLMFGAGIGVGQAKSDGRSCKDISILISILSDIIPAADSYPTSIEDAIQLLRRVPEYLESVNHGKGSVLQYKLEPIEKVQAHFNLATLDIPVNDTIDSGLIDHVERVFDTIVEDRIRLAKASNDILKYSQYISEIELRRINNNIKNFNREEREFKNSLGETIHAIQNGEIESSASMSKLLDDFEQGVCSSSVVDETIDGYQALRRRISFVYRCQKIGFQVIPRGEENFDVLSLTPSSETIILFIPKSIDYAAIEASDDWHTFRLLSEDSNDPQTKFMILDASITSNGPDLVDSTNLTIIKYYGDIKSNQDFIRASISSPSTKWSQVQQVTQAERARLTGHTLRMPCPLSHEGKCRSSTLEWVCFKCEEILQYDHIDRVYCRCGKTWLRDCTFRCDSIEHGYEYSKLHPQSIRSIGKKTYPRDDEINILLLGETGVGKSTFINAFANYLRYDSLKIAEGEEMLTLIQSSFEMEGTKVTAGKPDQNERLKGGQSSTQYCRSYVFSQNDNTKIRLIDTPGVGDTRGVEQDRRNFEEILNYISGFSQIHGICVLLLPNTSRLTVSFRFCIDELLLHLHKSAADNILFTFTNTRASFYKPGDTMIPLREYLAEFKQGTGITIPLEPNTIFCFDNESFRLYAALKQGLVFDPKTKETFGGSWEISAEEARRLVKRVKELTPHKTTESVTLDVARRSIYLLAEPMTKINENITAEVETNKKLAQEAQDNKMGADELRSRLICSYLDMEPVNLTSPRTVCTDTNCTTIHDKVYVYRVCHSNCSLKGVAVNMANSAILRHCWAMYYGDTCRICGCRWEKHMHVKIDYNQVKKQKTDTAVEKQLNETLSSIEKKQLEIAKADARKLDLELEKATIFKALVTFTGFLLQNSMLIQNNGILDYIDMSISNQEKIAQRTKDTTIVESLRAQREIFKAETEIFAKAIKSGETPSVPIKLFEVMQARRALCRLKVNGEALTKILEWGQQNQAQASNRETRIVNMSNGSRRWSISSTISTISSLRESVFSFKLFSSSRA